jgi:hypothetical protein
MRSELGGAIRSTHETQLINIESDRSQRFE